MFHTRQLIVAVTLATLFLSPLAGILEAQTVSDRSAVPEWPVFSGRRLASNIIVPQSRVYSGVPHAKLAITGVDASVAILDQTATTSLIVSLSNPSGQRLEAELLLPVPDGAVVRGFTFDGAAAEPFAELLPKEEARRIYEAIVSRMRDPALLEFAGYNMVRTAVFPVEAGGTQKVKITYENLLPAEGERIDYILPRSVAVGNVVPWNIKVAVKSKQPLSTVYSPSHKLDTVRKSPREIAAWTAGGATTEPGLFRLSCLRQKSGVTASLFAYPDPENDGGYFLLLAGLPPAPLGADGQPAIKREVTLVIDRSGSMQGEKIEQVREAALQILAGLDDGEAFNIVDYSDRVNLWSPEPVLKTEGTMIAAREYLGTIKAKGGTNIHAALTDALACNPRPGMLPIVLFLTDGLPTVGNTSEEAIRDVAAGANPFERRIFTFGVGVDVNTPLLSRIADTSRAKATFVLPQEDVELKVAQLFKRLQGPVLAAPSIVALDAAGEPITGRVFDMIPASLPDLFEEDQLVLTGRYSGTEPLRFKVAGNFLGAPRAFAYTFSLDKASRLNGFVARLWASRQIGVLSDAIRQIGGEEGDMVAKESRIKELVDEVVRLSTEFGILTEYTAFLAREGTDLSDEGAILCAANDNFLRRAVAKRSGLAAVNQDLNNEAQKCQAVLNVSNSYLDANMNRVATSTIQQVNDVAFYRREGTWIDSRLVGDENGAPPDRVIDFGSAEFRELILRLAEQGRQGSIALQGDIKLLVNGETVLVRGASGG